MATAWRPLPLHATAEDDKTPPLLLSTTYSSNSYTIRLTDLTYLWTESLDRRAIIKRSFQVNTSIDPSEDATQLDAFLERVKLALSGGEKTSLALLPGMAEGDVGSLELHITADLPGGLAPLKWPIYLVKSSPESLTKTLTMPLLQAQNERLKELASLVEILKDKDHVIQKLVDNLLQASVQLGSIFPGAAGKGGRPVERKVAEERVRGLGSFDLKLWKKARRSGSGSRHVEDGEGDVLDIMNAVFGKGGGEDLFSIAEHVESTTANKWWESVNATSGPTVGKPGTRTSSNSKNKNPTIIEDLDKDPDQSNEVDDDDFQVQATPPHLVTTKHTTSSGLKAKTGNNDDSTEDEDDLDVNVPSQKSAVPDSFPVLKENREQSPPRKSVGRLGNLGRSKTKEPAKVVTLAADTDDDTATEDDDGPVQKKGVVEKGPKVAVEKQATKSPAKSPAKSLHKSPEPEASLLPPPVQPTKAATSSKPKKGGLGKIGGKKKQASPSPEAVPEVPVNDSKHTESPEPGVTSTTTLPARSGKHKLGTIGHGKEKAKVQEAPKDVAAVTKEEEVPEETAKERADRKRAELKREMDEKAKLPIKKKRKF